MPDRLVGHLDYKHACNFGAVLFLNSSRQHWTAGHSEAHDIIEHHWSRKPCEYPKKKHAVHVIQLSAGTTNLQPEASVACGKRRRKDGEGVGIHESEASAEGRPGDPEPARSATDGLRISHATRNIPGNISFYPNFSRRPGNCSLQTIFGRSSRRSAFFVSATVSSECEILGLSKS